MAINKGKIITVSSVKGGTGKSITVLNLAATFALMGKKVLILDLDLYGGSIALSLNIDALNDVYKLVLDLENNRFDFIENYVTQYNENIFVLPSPKDPRFANKINSKYINVILRKAAMRFDVVLVDTDHSFNANNLVSFDSSDEVLYILNNDIMDLKNMKTIVSIYKDMEKNNYKIVLNNSVRRLKSYFSKSDIKGIMKENIDFVIPESFHLRDIDKYIIDGKIIILDKNIKKTHKKAIMAFEEMAISLLEEKCG